MMGHFIVSAFFFQSEQQPSFEWLFLIPQRVFKVRILLSRLIRVILLTFYSNCQLSVSILCFLAIFNYAFEFSLRRIGIHEPVERC